MYSDVQFSIVDASIETLSRGNLELFVNSGVLICLSPKLYSISTISCVIRLQRCFFKPTDMVYIHFPFSKEEYNSVFKLKK